MIAYIVNIAICYINVVGVLFYVHWVQYVPLYSLFFLCESLLSLRVVLIVEEGRQDSTADLCNDDSYQ